MLKKFLIVIGGVLLVVAILGVVKTMQIKKMMATPHVMPPTSVGTVAVESLTWNPVLNAIGTLAPVQGVTISADADGAITKIEVESGTLVKAGDLLIEIDATVELAQLKAAEARADLSKLGLDRSNELKTKNTISQAEYDAVTAQFNQAGADVAALKAQIDKKRVRAPFDGRVGIRTVNAGQYVARGQALFPLQKLNPIYANFSIPQRQFQDVQIGQKIVVTVDAFGAREFVGKVTAVNSEVDASTRNISIQATLENPEELLRSGMFARVTVELPKTAQVVAVPATAIAYASYGNSVFIVEQVKGEDGKEHLGVRQQFVKLGAARGDLVAITEGLKPGEKVVTSGVFKLRNGAPVVENNSVKPESSATPKPANT
ncbi:efflux RND transporter periplasmic adaptor subunit [Oleiharenicola lentus]|uniref:efflux RND transporter periplasmic adaptor subunit n=1 Tax=Oleiharenicola lentus TaxID=2508720 RepID=UPI003F661C27